MSQDTTRDSEKLMRFIDWIAAEQMEESAELGKILHPDLLAIAVNGIEDDKRRSGAAFLIHLSRKK